jgi:hypothetical protein
MKQFLGEIMNFIAIGNHVINLDQVTHVHMEEGSATFFFANQMPVAPFGGSEKPDKVDQLKFLGVEAQLVKRFFQSDKRVVFLDLGNKPPNANLNPGVEKWEMDNDFPSKPE